jgi:DNA-binding CsgD family transcriptional regulator
VENLAALDSSVALFEALLQSDSMLEVCRRFLFSDLNDFAHTIFVCSFSDRGAVKTEHSQGKTADVFAPPENIWESDYLSEALHGNECVRKTEAKQTLHILPLLEKNFAIGVLILIGDSDSEIKAELRNQLRMIQVLGGYFLALHLDTSAKAGRHSTPGGLSIRQLSILEHLCDSLTNAQIATRLHVSLSTVGQELMKIYRYLGVGNRNEACAAVRKTDQLVESKEFTEQESSSLVQDKL